MGRAAAVAAFPRRPGPTGWPANSMPRPARDRPAPVRVARRRWPRSRAVQARPAGTPIRCPAGRETGPPRSGSPGGGGRVPAPSRPDRLARQFDAPPGEGQANTDMGRPAAAPGGGGVPAPSKAEMGQPAARGGGRVLSSSTPVRVARRRRPRSRAVQAPTGWHANSMPRRARGRPTRIRRFRPADQARRASWRLPRPGRRHWRGFPRQPRPGRRPRTWGCQAVR